MRVNRQIYRVILLLWALVSCGNQDPLQQELIQLHDRTIPAGANLIEKSQLIRNKDDAAATWIFETDLDWASYSDWVTTNLPTYIPVREGTKLRLRKQLPGDVLNIQIELSLADNVRRIRVELRATPD